MVFPLVLASISSVSENCLTIFPTVSPRNPAIFFKIGPIFLNKSTAPEIKSGNPFSNPGNCKSKATIPIVIKPFLLKIDAHILLCSLRSLLPSSCPSLISLKVSNCFFAPSAASLSSFFFC